MTAKNLQNWSRTAANNVLANTGYTWDEGQAPSTLNNSARATMADLKEFFDYARTSQAWMLTDNSSATNAWTMTAYYTPYNASGDTTGLTAGQWYYGSAPTTVTSSLTLSVNSGTAKPVLYNNAAVVTGTITSGDPMFLYYDGTSFHIILINRIASQFVSSQFADGSASAPGMAFSADSNTGFYRISADKIGLATGGAQAISVDGSGHVGIGLESPLSDIPIYGAGRLVYVGTTTGVARLGAFSSSTDAALNLGAGAGYINTTGYVFVNDTSNLMWIGSGTATSVKFVVGDTEVARITTALEMRLTGTPTTISTDSVGFRGAPVNTQDTNYTFVLTDAGKTIYHTSGSAHTYTIPANASVAYPVGTVILIENENGGGNITLAITSDTLRWGSSTGSRTIAANGSAILKKMTSTLWRLTGNGIT